MKGCNENNGKTHSVLHFFEMASFSVKLVVFTIRGINRSFRDLVVGLGLSESDFKKLVESNLAITILVDHGETVVELVFVNFRISITLGRLNELVGKDFALTLLEETIGIGIKSFKDLLTDTSELFFGK